MLTQYVLVLLVTGFILFATIARILRNFIMVIQSVLVLVATVAIFACNLARVRNM